MNYNFYNEDDNNNDSTINTLLSYYKSNNDKITELNTTNTLLKREVASLMSKTFYSSILTNISESEYSNIAKYINKIIKRGDERYKPTKDLYNCILSELQQKISTDIKSIINIITRLGSGYRTIAFNIYFSLNDKEYELYVPMSQKITVDDVFYSDYIDMDVNKFQLYIHSSKCSWTRIWTGVDIGQIPDDVLKGDKT